MSQNRCRIENPPKPIESQRCDEIDNNSQTVSAMINRVNVQSQRTGND